MCCDRTNSTSTQAVEHRIITTASSIASNNVQPGFYELQHGPPKLLNKKSKLAADMIRNISDHNEAVWTAT